MTGTTHKPRWGHRPTRKRYWAMVANSGIAKLFEYDLDKDQITLLEETENASRHQPSRELASDSHGRVYKPGGTGKHSLEPKVSMHDKDEIRFTESLVEKLLAGSRQKRFDRFILIADARTLGRIRSGLPANLKKLLHTELAGDLTGIPLAAMQLRLRHMIYPLSKP